MESVSISPRGILVPVSEFIKAFPDAEDPLVHDEIGTEDIVRGLTFIPKNDFMRQTVITYGTPSMSMTSVAKFGVPLFTMNGGLLLIPFRADIFLEDPRKLACAGPAKLRRKILARFRIALESGTYKIPKFARVSSSDAKFTGKLRDYQESIVRQIEKYSVSEDSQGPRGSIISIPCGGGKTVIAIATVARLARKTVWITPKEFLENQLVSSVSNFAPALSVSKFPDMSGDIVTVIVNTAAMCKPADLKKLRRGKFGLCVIDEVHRIGTHMFSRSMFACAADITVGLSATPDRSDGGRSVIESIVGPVLVSMDRGESQGKFDVSVYLRYLEYKYPVSAEYMDNGTLSFTMTHSKLAEIPERIEDLRAQITDLVSAGHRVIVFSRIKSILKALEAALPGDLTGMYIGGSKSKKYIAKLREAETKQVILSTCSMGSEGLDIPGVTAVILETPRKDVRQMVGRILRVRDGKERVVIDYRDIVSAPVFSRSERERDRFYVSENYEVQHERITIKNESGKPDPDKPVSEMSLAELLADT